MASNFRISVHRKNGSLHLRLIGDFDGTSACELLNTLKENCDGVLRIFVNVDWFGRPFMYESLPLHVVKNTDSHSLQKTATPPPLL